MPPKKTTFSSYFKKYEDLYNPECANWYDFKMVHLRLSKLGTTEYTKFGNHILPKKKNKNKLVIWHSVK